MKFDPVYMRNPHHCAFVTPNLFNIHEQILDEQNLLDYFSGVARSSRSVPAYIPIEG